MTSIALRRAAAIASVLATAAVLAPTAAAHQTASSRGRAAAYGGRSGRTAAKAGTWVLVSKGETVEGGTPAAWLSSAKTGYLAWLTQPAPSTFTYMSTTVSASGVVSTKRKDVFAGNHWDGLSSQPTLVGSGKTPTLVFTGGRGTADAYNDGCIYGSQGPAWTLQTWSLSHNCVNPMGGAAASGSTLAAAWPGSNAVSYRIGTSTIPATGNDSSIPLSGSGTVYRVGMTSSRGDFYVGWAQSFTTPPSKDGFYVKDASTSAARLKVPGTGTNSINHTSAATYPAIAATNTHPGVFMATCNNASTCSVQLWKVGAAKARRVRGSANPYGISLSAGPSGRLWLAWFDATSNRVKVIRTSRHDTRFGPVQSFKTPCVEHGVLGLASGQSGRLDIGLNCVNAKLVSATYATTTLVPLSLKLSTSKVSHTSAHKVTATVTDAGDAVKGATVIFGRHAVITNAHGRATFTVAKGTKPGKYPVTAKAKDYRGARHILRVT